MSARYFLTSYLIMAALFATWADAMDRRYGVRGNQGPAAFPVNLFVGAAWPLTLPASLITIACCDGRWKLSALLPASNPGGQS